MKIMLLIMVVAFSVPLFGEGVTLGHDIFFHATRIEAIKQGLETGNFPVKLYGTFFNDYGCPYGFLYPDIFLYIPAAFRLMGFDMSFSYGLFLFLITLLTAALSFFSFNNLFRDINKGGKTELKTPYYIYGFAAAVLYTGALYRFVDLYVRAALGETIAMSFLPLALISFYLMLKREKNAWIFVVIGTTGILSSHLISSFLLFVSYVIMSLAFIKRLFSREVLKSLLKAVVFIALINLWFYFPFVDMYNSYDFYIKNEIKSAGNLSNFAWIDMIRVHFYVGILPITLLSAYLIFVLTKIVNKTVTHLDKIFLVCFLFCVVLVLFISPIAPWAVLDFVPILGEKLGIMQFSYRVTMFTCIFLSIALSIAICANKRFFIMTFIIPLAILYWMENIPWTVENTMVSICKVDKHSTLGDLAGFLKGTEIGDTPLVSFDIWNNPHLAPFPDYVHRDIRKTEFMTYLNISDPKYWEAIKNKTLVNLNPYEITPQNAVTNFSRMGLNLEFSTKTDVPTAIKLPLWYYPHCYIATCDGEEITVFETYKHRVTITAPKGEHKITVRPKLYTPYRNACIISAIGILFFIFLCNRELTKKEKV